jgi:hypothetical protein
MAEDEDAEATMDPGEHGTITISDRITGRMEITGTLIGMIDTRDGAPGQFLDYPRSRWGVNRVVKLGNGGYVLIREAFSLVYHTEPTTCRTTTGAQMGDVGTWEDIEDYSAVPCWKCHPPHEDDLGDDEQIRVEFPRRSVDQCENPAQVIIQLARRRASTGIRSVDLPEPARALIAMCQVHDPDFRDAAMPAVRIG